MGNQPSEIINTEYPQENEYQHGIYYLNDKLLKNKKEILLVLLTISALLFFILFFDSVRVVKDDMKMQNAQANLLEKIAEKLGVINPQTPPKDPRVT